VDPSIELLSTYPVGPTPWAGFDDEEVVRAAAARLYGAGADVIFHAAGDAGRRGIPKAAAEAVAQQTEPQRWTIGVDVDEYLLVEERLRPHVLTSLLKRHDLLVPAVTRRFQEGQLPPGVVPFSLGEGAVELSRSGGHVPATTWRRLDELRAAITSGAIVVPDTPIDGPSVIEPADAAVTLTVDGGACRADELQLVDGQILRVDVVNRSDEPAWVEVAELHTDASGSEALEDALPYTSVTVAPHGTQVLTALMPAGRFALACAVGSDATFASEVVVGGGFMDFPQPGDWSAPMLHPTQGFMFHPRPTSTDAIYLVADPAPYGFGADCEPQDGEAGSAAELAASLRSTPGVAAVRRPDVAVDGRPAIVIDVTLREGVALPCDRAPLFYGHDDAQLFRTDLRPGEAVRFLIFDAPATSPVGTGLIGIHATEGGDLDELVAVTADFVAALRFAT
jgi:hypothetical protein